jgi:two-component system NtrC family sensor kinase
MIIYMQDMMAKQMRSRIDNRLLILFFMIVVCVIAALFFDVVGDYGILYALFFFIPIIFAGMWFYTKAVYVAIFLGVVNILSASFPFTHELIPANELLRTTIFIVVAYAFGYVNKKRAEGIQELQNLSTAIEQTIDPVYVTDKEGVIEYVNPAFERLTGYSAAEVVGKTPSILKSGKHDRHFYEELWSTILSGKSFHAEIVNRKKTGELYYVERAITPIRDDEGRIARFIATGKDITERKKLEEELNKYTKDLEKQVQQRTREVIQAEKMSSLGVMVAGVAHEINNPLSYVKANTEIMLEELSEFKERRSDAEHGILDDLERLTRTNKEGIERIAAITTALKRFAKPDTSARIPADINQGIKDTMLIVRSQMEGRINVHEDYGDIPKIPCSIGQLNQVFMNVIMNSIEAMDSGDIWIKTWAAKENVYIEIEDNGRGIQTEILGRIFDPFFTTKEKGTGLGLTVSHRIIEDHKGEITVETSVGKGTRIVIRLPTEA